MPIPFSYLDLLMQSDLQQARAAKAGEVNACIRELADVLDIDFQVLSIPLGARVARRKGAQGKRRV
jgi:hypothetical protein